MPLHCHLCCFAGYEGDFELYKGFFLCNGCYAKMKKRIKEVLYPHYSRYTTSKNSMNKTFELQEPND